MSIMDKLIADMELRKSMGYDAYNKMMAERSEAIKAAIRQARETMRDYGKDIALASDTLDDRDTAEIELSRELNPYG